MQLPKRCFCCEGAGRFKVRSEQSWPDDGRDAPTPNEPITIKCPACDGTGEIREERS